MTSERIRVRFAPSPSGSLHVGNVRTALFNWLFARRHQGRMILRIEDTDQERSSDLFIEDLLADLKWLGIDWDEGPEKEGLFGPYFQSQRLPIYEKHLQALIKEGFVYPCYCTEEELEAERASLLARKLSPRYLGRCRDISRSEQDSLVTKGLRPAYRFRVETGKVEFYDLIRGQMSFDCRALGDFILVRSSGIPAYNFAVVIDDHLMEISHVIRGEDHLSNTALQVLLYRALGFNIPVFAHHSLILGKDHAKLSKRHGAVSVGEFRNQGFLPEALINFLALMGGTHNTEGEICSLGRLIDSFSLDKLGKGGAVFDEGKLRWFNSIYLRQYDPKGLLERITPFINKAGHDIKAWDQDKWIQIISALKNNLTTLCEIQYYLPMFLDRHIAVDPKAKKVLAEESSRMVILSLREALKETRTGRESLYHTVTDMVRKHTGLTGEKLFLPIRATITGQVRGPELDKLFFILGREAILTRVENALNQ